jgi:alkylhydroperoxidase/carboxymuconolactone decarboxylase family protein YurZ
MRDMSVRKELFMRMRKKILDYEYEEVLDAKTRELIRVGCAVAVGCPT